MSSETNTETNDNTENTEPFYSLSEEYWSKQPPTVNGMLGGFDYISQIDVEQSQLFLDHFISTKSSYKYKIDKKLALDCGAGIGRVSKNLLLKNFDNVEMVEVTKNFISEATNYLGEDLAKQVLKFHCCGLQDFFPEANKYDCIWIQWVLGYLKDNDLLEFMKRCKQALKPNGIIILKENLSQKEVEFDEEDSSVTRPRQEYINIIHKAGMHIVKEERQRKFPVGLYEVRLFAFK